MVRSPVVLGRHVGEQDVKSAGFGIKFGRRAEVGRVDVAEIARDGADIGAIELRIGGFEIDAHRAAGGADAIGGDLEPGSGGAPAVEHGSAGLEQLFLVVDFDELVGGAGEVAFALGQPEEVVVKFAGHGGLVADIGPDGDGVLHHGDADVSICGAEEDAVFAAVEGGEQRIMRGAWVDDEFAEADAV